MIVTPEPDLPNLNIDDPAPQDSIKYHMRV